MDGSVSAMETAAKTQLRFGATTIVPTALSGTEEEILNFIKYFKILKANMQNGPHLPGIHLEGPYFNRTQCGGTES